LQLAAGSLGVLGFRAKEERLAHRGRINGSVRVAAYAPVPFFASSAPFAAAAALVWKAALARPARAVAIVLVDPERELAAVTPFVAPDGARGVTARVAAAGLSSAGAPCAASSLAR
jgi:hypothetical protein